MRKARLGAKIPDADVKTFNLKTGSKAVLKMLKG